MGRGLSRLQKWILIELVKGNRVNIQMNNSSLFLLSTDLPGRALGGDWSPLTWPHRGLRTRCLCLTWREQKQRIGGRPIYQINQMRKIAHLAELRK